MKNTVQNLYQRINIPPESTEGLHIALALPHYSRARFIVNLLPHIQRATALRRVVSVFTGGKEGQIDMSDFQGWNVKSVLKSRGHASSIVTLSLEAMAKKAPDVTFIHGFPGAVKTGIARDLKGAPGIVLRTVFGIIGPFIYVPNQECGERHLFLATSAKYPPASAGETAASMVPLGDSLSVARGIDGKVGSGVYSIEQNLESAGPKVEALLDGLRKEGLVEQVWDRTTEEFRRITGVEEV